MSLRTYRIIRKVEEQLKTKRTSEECREELQKLNVEIDALVKSKNKDIKTDLYVLHKAYYNLYIKYCNNLKEIEEEEENPFEKIIKVLFCRC